MSENENQKPLKSQIHEAAEMLIRIMDQPYPPQAIGLPIGTDLVQALRQCDGAGCSAS